MGLRNAAALALAFCVAAVAAHARPPSRVGDPYAGAIAVRADTGEVLFEDQADRIAYPASVLKLMDLLIVLEKIEQGSLRLDEQVHVTAEAARIGGSQVYLAENEIFTIDELLYALMVQSANDAATALAIHIAGTKDGFVRLMNKRAQELGMRRTRFHSVHGLPPGEGQVPDISTARDMALLCQELLKHPDVLRYTSVKEKGFRNDTFMMRTHNKLLHTFPGCDGLKTGYYREAGFSLAATAEKNGVRVIAVVLGSPGKDIRNARATEILATAFLGLPAAPAD